MTERVTNDTHEPVEPVTTGSTGSTGSTEPSASQRMLLTVRRIGIVGGGLAVILVLAAVIVIPLAESGASRGVAVAHSDGSPSAPASTEFVRGYLFALAGRDAQTALEYVEVGGYDTEMLTDEVLEVSSELGPFGNIEIGAAFESEHDAMTVPVSFTLGEEKVSRTFEVGEAVTGDGRMTIADGLEMLPTYGFETLGLTADGIDVGDQTVAFPGAYEFGVHADDFMIEGGPIVIVGGGDDRAPISALRPALTAEALDRFQGLVAASLEKCLAMTTLSTPCGLDVTTPTAKGYMPVDGTVTRTLTVEGQSELAAIEARVSTNAVVTSSPFLDIGITVEGQKGDSRGRQDVRGEVALKTPKIDFAAETPTVVWE